LYSSDKRNRIFFMKISGGSALALGLILSASLAVRAQELPSQPQNDLTPGSANKMPTAPKKRHKPGIVRRGPHKIVVPEGGAKEPPAQIAPGLAPEEADRDRRDAEQWLSSTDGDLELLSARSLNPQQQETVAQVRSYLAGARSALKEGDLRRAHTMAFKAHLLSDDMVKHEK
jgi:hypothetical protein